MENVQVIGVSDRGQYLPCVLLELSAGWETDDEKYPQPILDEDDKSLLARFRDTGDITLGESEDIQILFDTALNEAVYEDDRGDRWRLEIADYSGDLLAYNSSALGRLLDRAVRVCIDCYEPLVGIEPGPDTPDGIEELITDLAESMDSLGEGMPPDEELAGFTDDLEDREFSDQPCECCGTWLRGERKVVCLIPKV